MTAGLNEPVTRKMCGERRSGELSQDARVLHGDALDNPMETILLEHMLEMFNIRQLGHNDLHTVDQAGPLAVRSAIAAIPSQGPRALYSTRGGGIADARGLACPSQIV
ncbi:MAG: hypothetical protein WBX25_25320 [Rhodomicrobium sp.]